MPRQGVMLAYKYDRKRVKKWKPPIIIQPKYNGERCRAIIEEGDYFDIKVTLLSSGANLINSVPHINVQLRESYGKSTLKTALPMELDGDLLQFGMDIDEVHSRVRRTVNLHKDYEAIDYYVYDTISNKPQHSRLATLADQTPFLESDNVFTSPTWNVATELDIEKFYNKCLLDGYEGIMFRNADAPYIRSKTPMLLKLKPSKIGTFTIIGMNREVSIEGVPKDALGAFVCKTEKGEEFKVGSGPFLTQQRRIDFWKAWNEEVAFLDMLTSHKMSAEIKYDELTQRGVPRFPSLIGITLGGIKGDKT